jgi:hypothetical protein
MFIYSSTIPATDIKMSILYNLSFFYNLFCIQELVNLNPINKNIKYTWLKKRTPGGEQISFLAFLR